MPAGRGGPGNRIPRPVFFQNVSGSRIQAGKSGPCMEKQYKGEYPSENRGSPLKGILQRAGAVCMAIVLACVFAAPAYTEEYTVSTAMGFKKMEHEGEEPYTLIAVGVCGANYDNEWQSNMTPGTGEMHEGFRSAAELVIDRISGYIMTRGIRGRIKLWISGFSRAAACFAPVLLLMNYSAGSHGTRIRAGAGMFLASDALLGLYGAVLAEPAVHAAGILLFYGSLLLFAAADFRKDRADQESR